MRDGIGEGVEVVYCLIGLVSESLCSDVTFFVFILMKIARALQVFFQDIFGYSHVSTFHPF